jgi:hypothetical protein
MVPEMFKPITPREGLYRIKQKNTSRYIEDNSLTKYEIYYSSDELFGVYTQSIINQGKIIDNNQLWRLEYRGGNCYRIINAMTGRYLAAYDLNYIPKGYDYPVTTREENLDDDSQIWKLESNSDSSINEYRINHLTSKRFLDAHENATHNYNAVTRDYQSNSSQVWVFERVD